MKLIACVIAVFLLTVSVVSSATKSREQNLSSLMKATGLVESFSEVQATNLTNARKLSDQFLQQLFPDSTALSPEQTAALRASAERYLAASSDGLSSNEAVAAWGRFYAASMSDEEISKVLAFYESPIGQKDVSASRTALPQFMSFMAARVDSVMRVATERYVAELRQIMTTAQAADTTDSQAPDTTSSR